MPNSADVDTVIKINSPSAASELPLSVPARAFSGLSCDQFSPGETGNLLAPSSRLLRTWRECQPAGTKHAVGILKYEIKLKELQMIEINERIKQQKLTSIVHRMYISFPFFLFSSFSLFFHYLMKCHICCTLILCSITLTMF